MSEYRQEVEDTLRALFGDGQSRGTRDFEAVGGLARRQAVGHVASNFEHTSETPVNAQRTLQGDVITPLLQALVSGAACFGGVLIAGGGFDVARVVGAGVGIAWWFKANWASGPVFWRFEKRTNLDINQDGHIGRPPEPVRPIIASVRKDNVSGEPIARQNVSTIDVTDRGRKLALDLAEFLTRGAQDGFARSRWTGKTLSSGTKITDPTWRQWTGDLAEAGILVTGNGGTRFADGVCLDNALRRIF